MDKDPQPRDSGFGNLDAASPQLIRNIMDSVPTMIAYFDRHLICQYGNASYQRMFGSEGQSLEGAPFEALVLPSKRDEIMPRVHAALRGQPQTFDYERPSPQGGQIHVEVKYTPDIQGGQVRGLFVELHDITDHKRIEDLVLEVNRDLEERVRERSVKLFESEERFRLMVDGLQDYCIYFLDDQGHITDWTESAQRMHRVPPHQALRQHLGLLMDASHPGRNPATRAQLLRQAIEHGHSETDGFQVRQGRPTFWAHTTLTALRNSRGELQGLSAITRDMTASKQLEEVLQDLNLELESRVRERTDELNAAHRDIDAFAHMVSHDLRAPLRHLSGFLMLLREDLTEHLPPPLPAGIQQHLLALEKASQRLAHMIEGVLEYARLGRTTLQTTRVALGPVVQAAVYQAQQAAGTRSLEWVLPADWPEVEGDAELLGQLLDNLLDNALKYTQTTPAPRVELDWNPHPLDPGRMTLRVRDNGVGFDRERAHNLFVMFQRQHHSLDFEGSGTGLALSRRLAEVHGGTLQVDSQVGQGCTVEITLPLAMAPALATL